MKYLVATLLLFIAGCVKEQSITAEAQTVTVVVELVDNNVARDGEKYMLVWYQGGRHTIYFDWSSKEELEVWRTAQVGKNIDVPKDWLK